MSNDFQYIDRGATKVCYRVLGPISNNVYCIDDGAGGVIIVDPEKSAELILEMAGEAKVSAIFITHRHHDHIVALRALHDATGAPVYASEIDSPDVEDPRTPPFGVRPEGCPVDVKLHDGDSFEVGACKWVFLHTPGHTEGSGCYYLAAGEGPNAEGLPLLFSGDTLFHAATGRTDFEGGNMDDMRASMRKLGKLPDDVLVCPGHGELTTIKAERERVIEYIGGTE